MVHGAKARRVVTGYESRVRVREELVFESGMDARIQ
jgi:hypothetical protein